MVRIPVRDPFGVTRDADMPSLVMALDPLAAQRRLRRQLQRLTGPRGILHLCAIRVVRYKPGRRCVIEYDVKVEHGQGRAEESTLIAKVRARRPNRTGYRLLEALWEAGFRATSPDGCSVPEPLGVVREWQMWVQRKVPGRSATDLLAAPGGIALMHRIAEAAHKLHRAGVPSRRRHTMVDELRILHLQLPKVAQSEPRWAWRLERLLAASVRLGATVPEPAPTGIHRDFYPDQVIVDRARLYLIDFDLYCAGDPGLDIGNFLGHISEQSLRTLGDAGALLPLEQALEERFVELAGEGVRPAVRAYATLTLVRHVYLSTLFPERRACTAALLELCAERLDIATRGYRRRLPLLYGRRPAVP